MNGKKLTANLEPRVTLLDALREMMDYEVLKRLTEQDVIEMIPLAKTVYAQNRSTTDRSIFRKSETRGSGFTVDTPVPFRIQDLIGLLDADDVAEEDALADARAADDDEARPEGRFHDGQRLSNEFVERSSAGTVRRAEHGPSGNSHCLRSASTGSTDGRTRGA